MDEYFYSNIRSIRFTPSSEYGFNFVEAGLAWLVLTDDFISSVWC